MEQDSNFLQRQLDSGVQVVGQPMAGVESAALGILIGTGARDEHPSQFGVTHLTEQMLFRGTESLDARELSERFDSLGVSYDSSAGIEMTLLSAVLLGDKLPTAIELMMDCARHPAFPADALENVRTLLIQELRQREDRPSQKVMDIVRQRLFRGSPLAHDVLGTEETIQALDRDTLLDYWKARYTPNNVVVSVAGNFDWDTVIEQLEGVTAGWAAGDGRFQLATPEYHADRTILSKPDASQEHLGFACPAVPVGDPCYFAAALFARALGGGTTSRLHREVREKRGLAYAAQARFDGLEKTGLVRMYVGTSPERAHESVQVVLQELQKLEQDGITEEELARAKTQLKSQLLMRSESTLARMAANLRSWWFEGKLHTLDDTKERIDSVTGLEILELVQRLKLTSNLAAVASGPRSEEELFGDVLTLA